ncbi:protein kinase [Blastocystis sp. subtype 4]|uniref:protein kinase n=1 Tax=Blastocystis sp. subtype 4 TaxID=944170 RepID=UPI00071148AC|nr:protein kinase [Blastocystis sp. subtype 4]KNB42856.1 protein kinase [Blastocystis sp. subtype 4]|eukprot:XP_014526299.1 protein kinase [Blastocystis sp. subtype 4]
MNLREVKVMMRIRHPNIVAMREVIRERSTLFFVMEYMSANLYECMKDRSTNFSEDQVRSIMYQLLQGLAYLHQQNIFHRDIKPENLLVKGDNIKIADFGLARETNSRPPYTEYISTRWYRAPEILLRSKRYNSAVDLWACGCIMAELMSLSPLFPGSNEEDQLYKICSILGSPTTETWKEGCILANRLHFIFPEFMAVDLSSLFPHASYEALNLLSSLLLWDPDKRPTAAEALQHPFFVKAFHPY